jgi:hypothetical protein
MAAGTVVARQQWGWDGLCMPRFGETPVTGMGVEPGGAG